jgi:acyl-CoA synthetase (AMP-forming)/AMP-acid ligase II
VQVRGDDGRVLGPGERGELWIRGPGVVRGYLFGQAADRFDGAGWLRTGDAGHVDTDGRVVIAGRTDDVINRGGELVDPAEVEAVLLQDPRVREAIVAGRPDDVLGAVPVAFVIPADGADDHGTDGLEQDLAHLAARHLPAFKRPVTVTVVGDVPRTAAGKVVRRRALELLGDG